MNIYGLSAIEKLFSFIFLFFFVLSLLLSIDKSLDVMAFQKEMFMASFIMLFFSGCYIYFCVKSNAKKAKFLGES